MDVISLQWDNDNDKAWDVVMRQLARDQLRLKQLEADNAELRERVAELELQVSLLTSNSVEYIITESDNTTPLMTEEECRAILSGDVDALDPSEGIG